MMEYGDPFDLARFDSCVDELRYRPDPYVLTALSKDLDRFAWDAREFGNEEDFICRVRHGVLDGFQRLDALPRDHPFWDGTNRRPTFGKLFDFAKWLLQENATDVRAMWTLAGASVVDWRDFDPGLWLLFVKAGGLNPSWPINAAIHGHPLDSLNIEKLVLLVQDSGLCEAAAPILRRLACSGREAVWRWAIRVWTSCMGLDLLDLMYRLERSFQVKLRRDAFFGLLGKCEPPDIKAGELYEFVRALMPGDGVVDPDMDAGVLWAMFQRDVSDALGVDTSAVTKDSWLIRELSAW
jgi:hypothetical protein